MKENDFEGKITVVAHTDDEEDELMANGAYKVLRPFQDAAGVITENIAS